MISLDCPLDCVIARDWAMGLLLSDPALEQVLVLPNGIGLVPNGIGLVLDLGLVLVDGISLVLVPADVISLVLVPVDGIGLVLVLSSLVLVLSRLIVLLIVLCSDVSVVVPVVALNRFS